MLHFWRCILGSRICLTVGIAHYFPQRADKMRAPACPPALPCLQGSHSRRRMCSSRTGSAQTSRRCMPGCWLGDKSVVWGQRRRQRSLSLRLAALQLPTQLPAPLPLLTIRCSA